MTAVASPLTVPEANKIIGRFYKGKEAAYPEYTNIFWYDIPALLAVAKKAVELMRQDSKRVFNDEVNTPASARPDTLDLEKMREIESFLEETLDNREKRKQLKNIREKINTFLNVEIIILIKNYLKFINSDRYKDIRDYARKNDIVRTSKAIKEFYATLAGDTFVKSSVDPAIAGKVQEWQDIENTARKISASSALSVPHDSHLKRYFASPMTAPEIKAKLLNIVAVGGYTFNPDLENGEFSQPHQSYSSRIAPLEEIPDLFDLAVKLLQEQSSDQNLKALVRQICRQEIGGLLQAAIKSNIKVEIEDIEEYVRKEEISQAADELSQIFNKTRGYYDEANYCNKISDAWRVASTASPLAGTKLKDAGSVDFIKGGIDFTDKAMRIGLERVGSFAGLKLVLPEISNVAAIDLDNEFKQIQIMATSGIRPSDNRILEFAAACYYRGEFDLRLGEITSCLQQAHFLDERLGRESSETLRLATILPEVLLAKI